MGGQETSEFLRLFIPPGVGHCGGADGGAACMGRRWERPETRGHGRCAGIRSRRSVTGPAVRLTQFCKPLDRRSSDEV